MATSFSKRCGSFFTRIPQARFPRPLIVKEAAIVVLVFLGVVGVTHFRAEVVAAGATAAIAVLTFLRYLADSRELAIGEREPDATRELPGSAVSHEHGEGRDVTVVVVVLTRYETE